MSDKEFQLFNNFTIEMEEAWRVAKEQSPDDLDEYGVYSYGHDCGDRCFESFWDFYQVLDECRKFPLWVMCDDEDEPYEWHFYEGTTSEILESLKNIAKGNG